MVIKKLHEITNQPEIKNLLAAGWKKSTFPVTESGNRYPKSENESRASDYKWETIVRHHSSKRSLSLNNPFLVLHAIPRNGANTRMDYAAIVTISAPKFEGDLYDAVLRRFTALQPIRLRSEAELRVRI